MKIAVFYNLAYGGAKRAVQAQVRELSKLGHWVDVYTIDQEKDNLSPETFAKNEYKYKFTPFIFPLPIISRFISDLSVFFLLKNLHRRIAQDIDRRKYDIVLAHADYYTQSPFILRFLKTKSAYYIMEPLRIVHEYVLRVPASLGLLNKIYENINRFIRKRIDIENARSSTFHLSISFLGKFYASQVYNVDSRVSYLGVDDELFRPQGIKKENQILFVAPKDYIFGYNLALDALNLIPKNKRPELKVIFGGEKEKRITDLEIAREYSVSLATLSLSRLDTFGLVPLESMASETLVIAANMSSYREIINEGKTGIFTEFDPEELAKKILFVINNKAICLKMGEEGRKTIKKMWTWEKRAKELESLLNEFIKK